MEIIKIDTWEMFTKKIADIFIEDKNEKRTKSTSYHSNLLFRGQSDSKWKLETTLERYIQSKHVTAFSACNYDKLIRSIKPFLNTVWDKKFEVQILENEIYSDLTRTHTIAGNNIEVKTLLRHYGFPSPLLDWTRSPYVAAWFAFNAQSSSSEVAIFVYKEYLGNAKVSSSSQARIETIGHYIETDSRHFIQQSEYTVCLDQSKNANSQFNYVCHEEAFKREETEQDRLYKIILPNSERRAALESLSMMNINASSLFQTKESFLATLALKELEISDRWM